MNVYLPNLRLPSAYQEVEYIQSSGTNGSSGQYINTGIIPESANTVVKLRTMPTSSSYSIYLCSCMKTYGTGQTNYYYGLSFSANRWHCGYGTPGSSGSGKALIDFSYTWNWGNTIYDVEYRNDDLYINGTLVANATTNVSNFQYPMFLFARNNDGTAGVFSSFKLYSCKIYKSGTLVRDFVPCYRKQDSVIGLYDLVNNQFYTNSGTGTFSKGNDVTIAVLKNAYIGEVWTPGSNTLAYYPLTASSTVNDQSGNGNNMTNNNSVTFGTNAGVSCGSFANSSSKYLSLNKALSTSNNPFTVSIWCYLIPFSSSTQDAIMLWGIGNNSSTNGIVLYARNVNFQGTYYVQYGWWGTDVNSGVALTANTWHNLVFTYDGTTMRVYLDGNKSPISTKNQTLNLSNTRTLIGASLNLSGANKWNGYLSEATFENKARTDAEVLNYYNTFKSNYGL